MQRRSLAAKASRGVRFVATPPAKRSAPTEPAQDQDAPGAPAAKAARVAHAAPGTAAPRRAAAKAFHYRHMPNANDGEEAHKVTILHVTKHLGRVAQAQPMVWLANSSSSTAAVRELQTGDGVILSVCASSKEVAEDYRAHIAPNLPPPLHKPGLTSSGTCFAVAAVRALHRSEVLAAAASSSTAPETGTWVELEPASLVWTNMPWEQLVGDFGVPPKAHTTSRNNKQANIAEEVRHYARQVADLLSRGAAQQQASGRRLKSYLVPIPSGHFVRDLTRLEDGGQAGGASAAASGRQQYDSGSGSDDDDSWDNDAIDGDQQEGTVAATAIGAASAAAAPAVLPAPPADVPAGVVNAPAGAGPSNAVAAADAPPNLAAPQQQQPAAEDEDERLQRLMRNVDMRLQSREANSKALAEAVAAAQQQAAAAAADAERGIAAAKAEYEQKLKDATASFNAQRKAEKKEFARMLAAAREQAAAAVNQRDAAAAARAAAELERDTARTEMQAAQQNLAAALQQVELEKGLRTTAEKEHAAALARLAQELAYLRQQRDAAEAAAQHAEAAKALVEADHAERMARYDTLFGFVERTMAQEQQAATGGPGQLA